MFLAQVEPKDHPKVTAIESVAQPEPRQQGWQNTAYTEIRNGSWAVLLVAALGYAALRGVVGKYLEKHMALLDTMRTSLEHNAESLKKLADAEQVQNVTQLRVSDSLETQGKAILAQGISVAEITVLSRETKSDTEDILAVKQETKELVGTLAQHIDQLHRVLETHDHETEAPISRAVVKRQWRQK